MSVPTGRRALRATAADQMCGIDARQAHQAAAAITVNLAALVGDLGSYLGPVIGALLLFGLQQVFGDFGDWCLAGIGFVAFLFALFVPQGLVGLWAQKSRIRASFDAKGFGYESTRRKMDHTQRKCD